MRYSRLAGLALAAALLLPELAGAQSPRVAITGVRVGYPGLTRKNIGTRQSHFKVGAWAPVYVDVEVHDAALKRGDYVLVVETTDGDDMQNVYVEKHFLPTVEPGESPALLAYVRVGSSMSEITVKVQDAHSDRVLKDKRITQADISPDQANYYSYLTLGGKSSSLSKALVPKAQQAQQQGAGQNAPAPGAEGQEPDPSETEETGFRSFAHIDRVQQMPTYWFGYQSIDTIVLLTGTKDFANELISGGQDDPIAVRREALAEWVRRGGRLIVSVSDNHQQVKKLLEQMKVIDLDIEGRMAVPGLPGVQAWARAKEFRGLVPKKQPGATPILEIAKLKPGPGVQVLAYTNSPDGKATEDRPIIVQAPCGLGQVIVAGFDLDQPPFTSWAGREDFWKQVKLITEPPDISDAQADRNQGRGFGFGQTTSGELAGELVRSLEAFPDVPVISFGWVALFILVYIIIVGPLDYLFLKKVVKRLELTWITFPAVVIVISAVAYFAAYYLKGKDLRINKVDVVDVDLHRGEVYGNTWFTLFSPRIQNYTLGVEPGSGWGADEKDPKKYAPFVSWMARPEEVFYGRGGQSLFRRAYNYAPDQSKLFGDQPPSSGLIGVPIQVWSTKTFSASWHRPIKADELLEARVEVARNDPEKKRLSGTITSHLPVELRDVVLLYHNKYYVLDDLVPGSPQRIDDKMAKAGEAQTWIDQGRSRLVTTGQNLPLPVENYMKSILFHATRGDNQGPRNSALHYLDQRWRLSDTNNAEAILFGRALPPPDKVHDGNAEAVSQSGLSASKLWLGGLPGAGESRRPIDGTLSQQTYVRVYIPVK